MKHYLTLPFIFASLLFAGCYSSPDWEESGPEVGPVAQVLDGDEDADPLAAEIDLSNEAAEENIEDPMMIDRAPLGM
ncbi:MAG: hypothetical protein AAGJ81_06035 [Verrucomicrobiota bacterium]